MQARGGITEEEVLANMKKLVTIMRAAVDTGRKGTEYKDRILPCQTLSFEREMNNGGLIPGDIINTIILYVRSTPHACHCSRMLFWKAWCNGRRVEGAFF
jgi:hypothetical protein